MISLKIAQTLAEFIILLGAYLIAVTPAGWFRALIALHMGDDTGKNMGLLTLNPFAHISIVGLICFLFPFQRFGWGRHVPVHLYGIDEKNRNLKFAAALFSDTFAHWFVALAGLVALGSLAGSYTAVTSTGATTPALALSYLRILGISINLSIFLSLVSGIVNGMTYYVAVHKPELYHDDLFNWYFLFAYLIIVMTIGRQMISGLFYATLFLSQLICHILGFTPL